MSISPYQDQIWKSTNCRDFENQIIRIFKNAGLDNDVLVKLIDAVNETELTKYPTIVTDNKLQRDYIPLWPEFWGGFSYNSQYVNRLPVREFNCFINRTDPIRQSWFYQLVRRNVIDKGYVSFLLDYRNPSFKNKQELYEWIFNKGCEIFQVEHDLMRDRVPFQNFDGDLDQIIVDSKISLVIETYFDRNEVITFSEKIFRALQLPRPFLLYSALGAVDFLKSQGFDVYDDVVDHSYDNEPDDIQRQIKILNQLEKSFDLVYTNETLIEYECRAEHNRQLLKKFKQAWPARLEKTFDILKNISSSIPLTPQT